MTSSVALQLVTELRAAGRLTSVEADVLRAELQNPAAEISRSISPGEFRRSLGLSMAAMAMKVGVRGKNPSRTWQRWEEGDRKPPYEIVAIVEHLSGGRVSFASWADLHTGMVANKETALTGQLLDTLADCREPAAIASVADLFDRFHGTAALGRAIEKTTAEPMSYQTLAAWKQRGTIPVQHWPALIAAARDIGLALDEAALVRIHLATPAEERA